MPPPRRWGQLDDRKKIQRLKGAVLFLVQELLNQGSLDRDRALELIQSLTRANEDFKPVKKGGRRPKLDQ